MKGYITYGRVSTDKQEKKGYSLRDQDARFSSYFAAHDLIRLQHFQDKVSAKNFERPGWRLLIEYVRQNLKDIAGIYIVSWDRFSRNITESFAVIKQLEALGLTINAIEQPIDHSTPESVILQAMYLATPDAENRRRSDKTRSGMRRAMKEGRWVNNAPIGYSHRRDESNKPIIVPNDEASLIAELFDMVSSGHTQAEAIAFAKTKGRNISKNNMSKLLRNPLYMGSIYIPEWKEEAAQTVKGIHTAIVESETWYQVQDILSGRIKKRKIPGRKQVQQELPLRGLLYCACGNKMTGSGSRSKTGARHFYYHCNACRQYRYKAGEVNTAMEMELAAIQFDKTAAEVFLNMCRDLLKKQSGSTESQVYSLEKEHQKISGRLHALQDKLLDGVITDQDYNTMKIRLSGELIDIDNQLQQLKGMQALSQERFADTFNVLGNIYKWYRRARVADQQLIVSSIFPGKIEFDGKKVRTPEINEVVRLISNTGAAFRIAGKRKGRKNPALFPTAARSVPTSNFQRHLELLTRLSKLAS